MMHITSAIFKLHAANPNALLMALLFFFFLFSFSVYHNTMHGPISIIYLLISFLRLALRGALKGLV